MKNKSLQQQTHKLTPKLKFINRQNYFFIYLKIANYMIIRLITQSHFKVLRKFDQKAKSNLLAFSTLNP